jgi:formate hydrogenlyase subunit 6/NADH:ubiquinone oxidoreductase subunit I
MANPAVAFDGAVHGAPDMGEHSHFRVILSWSLWSTLTNVDTAAATKNYPARCWRVSNRTRGIHEHREYQAYVSRLNDSA